MSDTPLDLPPGAGLFGYRAFGIFLMSDRMIPGLKQSANPGLPVSRVHFGRQPLDFAAETYQDLWFESWYEASPGVPLLRIFATSGPDPSFWLRYEDGTSIVIEERARALWITWAPESCFEESLTYLFGPVMALLAQVRGVTCLHGSAVAIDGVAIALIGRQGAGKSTSAAAFARLGYPIVADDIILLQPTESGFAVEPTYPIVRLWPSSVELLFGFEEALPLLSPQWEKRALNATEGEYRFQQESLPLAAIYLLRDRSDAEAAPFIEPVAGAAALIELLSNSWAHYANRPDILARQFRVFSRLSESVPIRHVTASVNPARLADFCRLLRDDAAALKHAALNNRP